LEFTEFGEGAAQGVVSVGTGAVEGVLLVCRGVIRVGGETSEVFFHDAAATETPGGAHDLCGEGLFENIFRGELSHEGGTSLGILFGFAVADEGVGGEKTVFRGIAG
jgi:hypothetical protein